MQKMLQKIIVFVLLYMGFTKAVYAAPKSLEIQPDIRLYTLNCGYIHIHDEYDFSDTRFYPHKLILFADPCFLVKHNNEWLLWDTGLGDKYLGRKSEDIKHGVTLDVPVSLTSQLHQLGLVPGDIEYVGLSHTHFDHVGNVNLFLNSKWLIQFAEYQTLNKHSLSHSQDISSVAVLQSSRVKKILLNGDYDVFSDHSVVVLSTQGHTIGHQSLEVKLPHAGIVILSGDLYHTKKAYRLKQIPTFNASRADTLASMSRIDNVIKNTHAKLIIQHDMDQFNSLPKFPNYLD